MILSSAPENKTQNSQAPVPWFYDEWLKKFSRPSPVSWTQPRWTFLFFGLYSIALLIVLKKSVVCLFVSLFSNAGLKLERKKNRGKKRFPVTVTMISVSTRPPIARACSACLFASSNSPSNSLIRKERSSQRRSSNRLYGSIICRPWDTNSPLCFLIRFSWGSRFLILSWISWKHMHTQNLSVQFENFLTRELIAERL